MSCPRDPSQITWFSPEGLATRRSIEINGNYFTRERDEWAAGRETSSFVVPLRVTELPVTRAHTHTLTNARIGSYTYTHGRQESTSIKQSTSS